MTVSKFDIPKFGYDLLAVINDIFPLTTTCAETNGGKGAKWFTGFLSRGYQDEETYRCRNFDGRKPTFDGRECVTQA